MGTKVLAMSEELLLSTLRAQLGTSVGGSEEGLPEDVRVVGARQSWNGLIEFKLVSNSYELLPEGSRPPWLGGRFLT